MAANSLARVALRGDPPLYTNQDTIARPPVESKDEEFVRSPGPMRLGKAAACPLTLRALKIPGHRVMDARQG
jgi:hypothetical protein